MDVFVHSTAVPRPRCCFVGEDGVECRRLVRIGRHCPRHTVSRREPSSFLSFRCSHVNGDGVECRRQARNGGLCSRHST